MFCKQYEYQAVFWNNLSVVNIVLYVIPIALIKLQPYWRSWLQERLRWATQLKRPLYASLPHLRINPGELIVSIASIVVLQHLMDTFCTSFTLQNWLRWFRIIWFEYVGYGTWSYVYFQLFTSLCENLTPTMCRWMVKKFGCTIFVTQFLSLNLYLLSSTVTGYFDQWAAVTTDVVQCDKFGNSEIC